MASSKYCDIITLDLKKAYEVVIANTLYQMWEGVLRIGSEDCQLEKKKFKFMGGTEELHETIPCEVP